MQSKAFDNAVLGLFRRLYFPVITKGVITGYNVYLQRKDCTAKHAVNYLHSDLGILPSGRPHPHREELIDKLAKYGPAQVKEKIVNSIVDRITLYKVGSWKSNPAGLTFYDANCRIVSRQALLDYEGLLIVEGKQYDLCIEADNKRDLEQVLRVLNKYTYQNKTGHSGRILDVPNETAITGAWEIPLITITSNHAARCGGFEPVSEVSLFLHGHESCTLTTAPGRICSYLRSKGRTPMLKRKLVNRPFVRSYLEAKS